MKLLMSQPRPARWHHHTQLIDLGLKLLFLALVAVAFGVIIAI